MNLQSREDLIANLHSKPFRDAFVSSRVSNTLALQIRAMRQERGWSQAYLAELLGTSQNAVYRLESPQYGKPSITTLKRLASIFDVGLAVWFAPFSKLVDRITNLETEDILVPSFDEDQALHESERAAVEPHSFVTTKDNPFLTASIRTTTSVQRRVTIDLSTLFNEYENQQGLPQQGNLPLLVLVKSDNNQTAAKAVVDTSGNDIGEMTYARTGTDQLRVAS